MFSLALGLNNLNLWPLKQFLCKLKSDCVLNHKDDLKSCMSQLSLLVDLRSIYSNRTVKPSIKAVKMPKIVLSLATFLHTIVYCKS